MRKKVVTIRELSFAGLFTAVIAVLSLISFPLPSGVPVTLQTFAVALCGFALGRKLGLFSIAAYILLGTAGAPVFSGFRGGAGVLFGVTGGFIFGFIAMVFLCGLASEYKSRLIRLLLGFAGFTLCHIGGIIQFAVITDTGFFASAAAMSLPYLLKDAVSVTAAMLLAEQIKKALAKAGIKKNKRSEM